MTTPSPKKRTAADKATVLAIATEALSSRVGTLADAVQINNARIEEFQKELNKKPDDVELKFVEEQARRERFRYLRYSIGTALLAALVSGYVSFDVANRYGAERCETNAKNIDTLVSVIDRPGLRERYTEEIADLRSNRNDCE